MDSKWLDVYAQNHLSNRLSLHRYMGKYHKGMHLRAHSSGQRGDHRNSAVDVNAVSGYQQVCELNHFQQSAVPLLILASGDVTYA